jgi:RHS repeat-associated protein
MKTKYITYRKLEFYRKKPDVSNGNRQKSLNIPDLGFLDFGARMLETEFGRWFVQDPLQEKFYSWSSYNYCLNNPLKFVDIDGRFPLVIVVPWVVTLAKAAFATAATATVVVAASTIHGDTGYREQEKRERNSRREDADIAKRHNDMIDNHVGKPTPDGTPDPKRSPKSDLGKVVLTIGGTAAAATTIIEGIDGDDNNQQKISEQENDKNNNMEQENNQQNQTVIEPINPYNELINPYNVNRPYFPLRLP